MKDLAKVYQLIFFVLGPIAIIYWVSPKIYDNIVYAYKPNSEPVRKSKVEFSDPISCILEDSKNRVWIGSTGSGFCLIDPNSETTNKPFQYFTVNQGLPYVYIDGYGKYCFRKGSHILDIIETDDNRIVISTYFGICEYKNGKLEVLKEYENGMPFGKPLEKLKISINKFWPNSQYADLKCELKHGDWLSTMNGYCFFRRNKFYKVELPEVRTADQPKDVTYSRSINRKFLDSHDNLWLSIINYGFLKLGKINCDNSINGNWFSYKNEGDPYFHEITCDTISENLIFEFYEATDGKIWIGDNVEGILYYEYAKDDKSKNQLVNLSKKLGLKTMNSKSKNNKEFDIFGRVLCINEDKYGGIWFGTLNNGLWCYKDSQMTHYTTRNGLSNNRVTEMHRSSKGELLFAIGRNKSTLYTYTGKEFIKAFN